MLEVPPFGIRRFAFGDPGLIREPCPFSPAARFHVRFSLHHSLARAAA
jgi:hypothetical protein